MKPIAVICGCFLSMCVSSAHAQPSQKGNAPAEQETTLSYPGFYADWQAKTLRPGLHYKFFACLDAKKLVLKMDNVNDEKLIGSVVADSRIIKQLLGQNANPYCGPIIAGVKSGVGNYAGPGSPPMVHIYKIPGLASHMELLRKSG